MNISKPPIWVLAGGERQTQARAGDEMELKRDPPPGAPARHTTLVLTSPPTRLNANPRSPTALQPGGFRPSSSSTRLPLQCPADEEWLTVGDAYAAVTFRTLHLVQGRSTTAGSFLDGNPWLFSGPVMSLTGLPQLGTTGC